MRIRAATPDDAAVIAEIYAPYVNGTNVTFETDPPGAAEIRARIEAAEDIYPWLVAEADGEMVGYAYACAFRSRAAYRFSVETSVYLRQDQAGRGLGRRLYEPLLETLERQGFTQAIAAIAGPNEASAALHEKLGFVLAGTYRQVGWKLGAWRDVALWQRALAEPRTPPPEPLRLSELRAGLRPSTPG